MQSDLRATTLGSICKQQGGTIQTGPFGSQLHASDYDYSGTPVIMPLNLANGIVETSGIARVSQGHVERLSRHCLVPGDIVFSRRGDVTRFALITERERGWLCGTGCLKVSAGTPTLATANFIAAALASPVSKEWLIRHAVGATMPNLNTGILGNLPISLPPLVVQENVTRILGALNDRLQLLRQTNATLEAIAQTMFKSWLIDFDPMHAKAEGREPDGMDAATAALFPDSFEDSPLGPIPQGWHASSLSDCMELNPQRVLRKGSLASYLDMANAPTQGHRPAEVTQRELGSGSKFINGDTLLAKITPCLENGKTAFVDFLADNEVGWGSTEFIVMRPKGPLPPFFGYLLARMPNFRAFAIQAMTGTSGRQRVDLGSLKQFSVVVPDDGVAEAFGKIIEPLRARIAAASSHADSLSQLRDTVLPRLISGKLRLPEVSGLIEEAIA